MKKDLGAPADAEPDGDGAASAEDIKRFRENFQGEVDGVAIYQRLARAEKDESRRAIFLQLAETEKRHLKVWEDRLRAAGVEPPARRPSFRIRVMSFLADRIGVRAVLPMVSAMESSGFDNYMAQADAGPAMARNERAHARTLASMYQQPSSVQFRAGADDFPAARTEPRA